MLTTDNLAIGYCHKAILDKLNYRFDNRIYGILGGSGKGKTTFLRTIAGLIRPISGKVILDGKKIEKANRNGIYMMHQGYTCFNWLSVMDNVLLARKLQHKVSEADKIEALHLLKEVGLYEYRDKYPQQLSGGQRQRLALARTIFANPQVILMDEPLSALDQDTRRAMQELVLSVHRKSSNTIIMVTHSQKEAETMCDKIIYF